MQSPNGDASSPEPASKLGITGSTLVPSPWVSPGCTPTSSPSPIRRKVFSPQQSAPISHLPVLADQKNVDKKPDVEAPIEIKLIPMVSPPLEPVPDGLLCAAALEQNGVYPIEATALETPYPGFYPLSDAVSQGLVPLDDHFTISFLLHFP
ncbi:hypothetical protein Ciccas_001016 [Cichlidogyrus casuarinus]|uniref:Uncharacterized protein n=1 Tax=Cichlidogyrus casuarinus TaxID=1844966 RepID=A0ABD2QP79_9PLAT